MWLRRVRESKRLVGKEADAAAREAWLANVGLQGQRGWGSVTSWAPGGRWSVMEHRSHSRQLLA